MYVYVYVYKHVYVYVNVRSVYGWLCHCSVVYVGLALVIDIWLPSVLSLCYTLVLAPYTYSTSIYHQFTTTVRRGEGEGGAEMQRMRQADHELLSAGDHAAQDDHNEFAMRSQDEEFPHVDSPKPRTASEAVLEVKGVYKTYHTLRSRKTDIDAVEHQQSYPRQRRDGGVCGVVCGWLMCWSRTRAVRGVSLTVTDNSVVDIYLMLMRCDYEEWNATCAANMVYRCLEVRSIASWERTVQARPHYCASSQVSNTST